MIKYEWPIQQPDGSIIWLPWNEMKQRLGAPPNTWDEVQKRLTNLMRAGLTSLCSQVK